MTDYKTEKEIDRLELNNVLTRLSKETLEYCCVLGNDIFEERHKRAKGTYADMMFINEDRSELRGYLSALVHLNVITKKEYFLLNQYFSYFDKKYSLDIFKEV